MLEARSYAHLSLPLDCRVRTLLTLGSATACVVTGSISGEFPLQCTNVAQFMHNFLLTLQAHACPFPRVALSTLWDGHGHRPLQRAFENSASRHLGFEEARGEHHETCVQPACHRSREVDVAGSHSLPSTATPLPKHIQAINFLR